LSAGGIALSPERFFVICVWQVSYRYSKEFAMKLNHLHSTASVKHGPLVMRKKLTAPALAAMILLTACGGGEDSTQVALNTVPEAAQAVNVVDQASTPTGDAERQTAMAAATPVWAGIEAFHTFFQNKFHPVLARKARAELAKQWKIQFPSNPLDPNTIYDFDKFNEKYRLLNSKRQDAFNSNLPTQLWEDNEYYTKTQLTSYKNWIANMADKALNVINQNRSEVEFEAVVFLQYVGTEDDRANFLNRRSQDENVDDGRYLSGTEQDSIEEYTDAAGRTNLRVKFGDRRKPIERKDAVQPANFFPAVTQMKDFWDPRTEVSKWNEYGMPSRRKVPVDPANPNITRADWEITDVQESTLIKYISDDITKYGPISGMTEDQSYAQMFTASRFLMQTTGQVYDSYVRGQLIARFIGQGAVAMARMEIYNKFIDFPSIIESVASAVENAELAISQNTLNGVTVASVMGSAAVVGYMAASILTWTTLADEFKKGTDKDQAIIISRTATLGALTTYQSILALRNWGLLTKAAYDPGACDKNVVEWLPFSFSSSDFLSGANMMADVLWRSPADPVLTKPQKVIKLTNAFFNMIGGGYGMWSAANKVQNWGIKDYSKPILVATAVSAANCMFSVAAYMATP
jgi:hypothetical protein